MNNTNIEKVVQLIESEHAEIDWATWQLICEMLEKRSHQI